MAKRLIKSFYIILLVALTTAVFTIEADAQYRKKSGFRARSSNYRGLARSFPKRFRYNSFGGSLNSMNYFGDITPRQHAFSTDLSLSRPGASFVFTRRYGPRYSFRAQLSYGRLKGDDNISADPYSTKEPDAIYRYKRNLQFRNNITELSLTMMFDMFSNRASYLVRAPLTPYVAFGLSLFHHNPKAKVPETYSYTTHTHTPGVGWGSVDHTVDLHQAGEWVALQPLGTEGQYLDIYDYNRDGTIKTDINGNPIKYVDIDPYSLWQISIPISLGLRYKINRNLDFAFEVGFRYLFTDYIDDVSAIYLDQGAFSGPNADLIRALHDRSLEPIGAASGDVRFIDDLGLSNPREFTSRFPSGYSYGAIGGYGIDTPELLSDNIRGNQYDKDIFIVTSFTLTYVMGSTYRRAKFR